MHMFSWLKKPKPSTKELQQTYDKQETYKQIDEFVANKVLPFLEKSEQIRLQKCTELHEQRLLNHNIEFKRLNDFIAVTQIIDNTVHGYCISLKEAHAISLKEGAPITAKYDLYLELFTSYIQSNTPALVFCEYSYTEKEDIDFAVSLYNNPYAKNYKKVLENFKISNTISDRIIFGDGGDPFSHNYVPNAAFSTTTALLTPITPSASTPVRYTGTTIHVPYGKGRETYAKLLRILE